MKRHNPNQADFKVLYDRHFDAVARYCLRRLPEHIAQDATSEVFLTAWRRFDSIPPDDEALPWLYGVARNVVRNTSRSQRRSMRLSSKFKAQPHDPDNNPARVVFPVPPFPASATENGI